MKKVLIALALPAIIGLAVFFYPRPVAAEPQQPYHERVVNDLWQELIQAPQLVQELYVANPAVARAALVESPDCLVCKAIALMALRQYDGNWADTLGESAFADDLDQCVITIIYEAEHTAGCL